jgi:hypothetical protein
MNKSITLTESYPPISESIKRLAEGVFNNSQPTYFLFGVVESIDPLMIRINPKMILPDAFLILTNAVKDHSVDVTVDWSTVEDNYLKPDHTHGNGNNGSPTTSTSDFDTTHKHDIKGRKRITIHNGLTVGEKVLLLRTQGGQNYVVIDRVDEAPTEVN